MSGPTSGGQTKLLMEGATMVGMSTGHVVFGLFIVIVIAFVVWFNSK